jgi:hypothetical protein
VAALCLVRIGRNPVVKSISLGAVVSAAFLIFADSACAADARVKVALLDGAPVYHWRVFKSRYSDDIDRALVLREFKRRGFTLPDKFVEKALQQEIAEKYNGDKTMLERSLQRAGMTMGNYRQFLAEELMLQALPIFIARHSKDGDSPAARAKWIASLREGANIKLLR